MPYDLFGNPDNACDIKYIDTPIQGHLVTAASFMHVSHATSMHTDYIKKQLVHMLAAGLIDKKLISFTKIDDPLTLTTSFYARGFLVSDDKVRLIRTLVK
jgi:hypothetical protein